MYTQLQARSLAEHQFAVNVGQFAVNVGSLSMLVQFAVNDGSVRCQRWSREEVSYPPPSATPSSLATPPPTPNSPPSLKGEVRAG
jgi:hypothetical protein